MVIFHIFYITTTLLLALSLSEPAFDTGRGTFVLIGTIGIWRYSWAATNFTRAFLYCRIAYPRLRARAEAAFANRNTQPHAYFLITSYKISPAISCQVYQAAFAAAATAPGGATLVASVVDRADARLIRRLFALQKQDMTTVKLIVDQIPGTGKRDALARSFRLIAQQAPMATDVVAVIDGDSIVPRDLIRRTAPFFCDPKLGALTTDEVAHTLSGPVFRDWFALRFRQRHVMMSAMALGQKVLTLTGRLSVFRASLVTQPGFIAMVARDHIDHWRHGRIDFLTGDDKSTWYHLLKSGHRMLYLPDVRSISLETQPAPHFVPAAASLMVRWFGNMLRTNSRALRLSPRHIGVFTWWSLLDQKISIWTTLAGPLAVLLGAVMIDPLILPAYLAWVLATRYIYCMALGVFGRTGFPASFPLLLYFSQITGAAVKSFVLFRLNRQRWTRQQAHDGVVQTKYWSSAFVHCLALGWLCLAVLLLSDLV